MQLFLESMDKVSRKLQRGLVLMFGGTIFAASPLLMMFENYADHDRSGTVRST